MNKIIFIRIMLFSAAALLLGLVLLFWFYRKTREEIPPPALVPPVRLTQPVQTDLSRNLILGGTLESESTITILPRVSGLLIDVLVEEGDRVEKGQILARIDPAPYDLELASAESAYLLAESNYLRIKRLFDSSGASQQQLEETNVHRDAAFSSFKLAKLRRTYADISSPLSGEVMKRLADPGTLVSSQVPLAVVGGGEALQVKVRIPEKYYSDFFDRQGKALQVFRQGDDTNRVSASIQRVSPSISPRAKNFEVTCILDQVPEDWRPGMGIKSIFSLESRQDVWTLPLETLGEAKDLWWVDLQQDTAHRISVDNAFFDDKNIEIPPEYQNRLFVFDGQHRLSDGGSVLVLGEV